MKREQPLDDRLERLLDEELQAVIQAPPVDLRAKVLQAIDEGRGTRGAGRRARDLESASSRVFQPRWALALAAAAVLVLAVLVPWRGSVQPGREPASASRVPLASSPIATAAFIGPSIAPASRVVTLLAAHRPRPLSTWDTTAAFVDDVAISNEPYLPGAPAGELGDPLRPLPSPPPISFAAIASAPLVSDFARPVTDFPADNPAPAQPSGEAGPRGGTRR